MTVIGRGGGAPPDQARTTFVRGLIQEMGGNPQDLRMPPPLKQEKSRGRGQERKAREEPESGWAHLPH